jgi:hypothetical protein
MDTLPRMFVGNVVAEPKNEGNAPVRPCNVLGGSQVTFAYGTVMVTVIVVPAEAVAGSGETVREWPLMPLPDM